MSKRPVRRGSRSGSPTESPRRFPEVVPVGMSGEFPNQVSVVPGSTTSLILASATEHGTDRPVLVPFVDLKVAGVRQSEIRADAEEQEFGTLLTSTIPLENAAFLYFDLVRDLRIALVQLMQASGGHVALEPKRLSLTQVFVDNMAAEITGLQEVVAKMAELAERASAADEKDRGSPAPRPAARPETRSQMRSSPLKGVPPK